MLDVGDGDGGRAGTGSQGTVPYFLTAPAYLAGDWGPLQRPSRSLVYIYVY